MKKIIFSVIVALCCTVSVLADDNNGGMQTGQNGGGQLDPTGRPKSNPGWMNVYTSGNQMWFTFSSNITGFSATVTNTTTGQCVVEYITDNTPFTLPFSSGHIEIICITDNGDSFEGSINL